MNELKHLDEFKKILANYHVSDESKDILKDTKLMLFAAATSAGRNTIFKELLKTGHYHYIISDTTRKPRVNDGVPEKNGVEYWFKTEEEMLDNLRTGKMLEAAVIHNQQVSGISMDELKKARDENKIAITDIEVVGTDNIEGAKPDTVSLFIIPPSFEEWQRRLKHRGRLELSEYNRRLQSAAKEFKVALAKDYYWIIVNDNLADVVQYVDNIGQGLLPGKETQAKNRAVLQDLLEKTEAYLATL